LGDTPKPSAGDLLLHLFIVVPLSPPLLKGDSRELRTQSLDPSTRFQSVVKSVGHRPSSVNQRYVTLLSLCTTGLRYVIRKAYVCSQYACISVR